MSLCKGVIDVLKEGTHIFGVNLLKWIFCPLLNDFYIFCLQASIANVFLSSWRGAKGSETAFRLLCDGKSEMRDIWDTLDP